MRLLTKATDRAWPKCRHIERLTAGNPALRRALKEAGKLWGNAPGVLGFGLGKKIKGRSAKIQRISGAPDGLCVHVFVAEKKKHSVLGDQVIPKAIKVKVPGKKRPVSVPTDVVCLGEDRTSGARVVLESGPTRAITIAGTTNAGRIFGIFPGVTQPAGVEAGTVGAFIRGSTGECYAITAGHVIVNTAVTPWVVPPAGKQLRLADRQGVMPAGEFYPRNLGNPPRLYDALMFRVPPQLVPQAPYCSWPSVFDGTLATPADGAAALGENREGSFLWVQRERQIDPAGQSAYEPWGLEVNIIGKAVFQRNSPINGATIQYPELWWYRYPQLSQAQVENPWQISVGGDSGAGLYVRAAENPNVWRLLGFHIYRYFDPLRSQWWGMAMPAEQWIQMIAGRHQEKWWFYGKE